MLPITATPSAPPTWIATPFVAEPTPASPGGTDPITASVAVGISSPAPRPIRTIPGRTSRVGGRRPRDHGGLEEAAGDRQQARRSGDLAPREADDERRQRRSQRDDGRDRQDPHARLDRRQVQVELEELGLHEQRAEQREDSERERRGRRREPAGPEEREVEHRMVASRLPGDEHARARPDRRRPTATTFADDQPWVGASMIAQRTQPRPSIESTPPTGSGRVGVRILRVRHEQQRADQARDRRSGR